MNSKFLIEFYAKYGHLPGQSCGCEHSHNEFRLANPINTNVDNTMLITYKTPPEKQLKYLQSRGANIQTADVWDSMISASHDKAFTVANVMKADILQTIYDGVHGALADGKSLDQFQKELMPMLDKAGWSGNNPHRLKTIYETNLETTYAKSAYENDLLLANEYPFWQWMPSRSFMRDPVHIRFYGLVLRADDPFWKKHYPRGRYGCKCDKRILSEKQLKEKGYKVSDGSQFIDKLRQNEEFAKALEQNNKGNLDLLKQWEPELSKYAAGIGEQLAKVLAERGKISVPVPEIPTTHEPVKVPDNIPDVAPAKEFVPAKTIKEAKEFAAQTLGIIKDKSMLNNLDNYNTVNKRLYKLRDDWIGEIYYYGIELRDAAVASCGGRTMNFNPKYFNNPKAFWLSLEKAEKNGSNPKGCFSVESVIDHEYAHALTNVDIKMKRGSYNEIKQIWDNYHKDFIAKETKKAIKENQGRPLLPVAIKQNLMNSHDYISEYAETNLHEFASESFTMVLNNRNPSKYAKQVYDVFVKYYQKGTK